MIPAKCHLQGQLFTLIKCPELLGQICWTLTQITLSYVADLSWPSGRGWGFVCQGAEQRTEFAFQIQLRWESRMRSGETSSIKDYFPSSAFFLNPKL